MARKLFMLMAAFVLILCMKNNDVCSINKNRQYGKCRLRYVYPYRHYETWKRNCLPQGKK